MSAQPKYVIAPVSTDPASFAKRFMYTEENLKYVFMLNQGLKSTLWSLVCVTNLYGLIKVVRMTWIFIHMSVIGCCN